MINAIKTTNERLVSELFSPEAEAPNARPSAREWITSPSVRGYVITWTGGLDSFLASEFVRMVQGVSIWVSSSI